MNKLSLRKKILSLVIGIAIICPMVAGIITYKNNQNNVLYQAIAERQLPVTRDLGNLLFSFREVRIQVRSLAIRGNTAEVNATYLNAISKSIEDVNQIKAQLASALSGTAEERQMFSQMEKAWESFEKFGGSLLELNRKGDVQSLEKLAEEVRVTCPRLSKDFEDVVRNMIESQRMRALQNTALAKENAAASVRLSMILALLGIGLSVAFGFFFSSSLSSSLIQNMNRLSESAGDIAARSNGLSQISVTLSESTAEQSASLQETAASMDEISAMVRRNSDSALSAASTSQEATQIVREGKGRVQEMIASINAISDGNREIMDQMQRSNDQIAEIVGVIKNIATKTNVINDIVFQTKLLSFNASVEAARAGDHGKGFSVVAEEVGNLASMSGNAAKEISGMLEDSVVKVTSIVSDTRSLMDSLMSVSRSKIENGSKMAVECGRVFDQIHGNVTALNAMVNEIATASREQTSGIEEVNKAVSQLESVTQETASSSQQSNESAAALKTQSETLYAVVGELGDIINGSGQVKTQGVVVPMRTSSRRSEAA